jgi:glucose/arabinose dehydrogenase/PKD repeat protein
MKTIHSRLAALVSITSAAALLFLTRMPSAAPQDFNSEIFIASGLNLPTSIEFLPGGRMLIAELFGRIVVVQAGATTIDATPVAQLTNISNDEFEAGGERGLVGMVSDPNFSANGFLYVFYTAAVPLRDRVSRFILNGNTLDLQSEVVVWQDIVDAERDHHGGGVAFGPDGRLYISTGDHFAPADSQSLTSYHGKVIRINPDGSVPADNPFFDGTGPNLDGIWARGLRNPFRLSFDSLTGEMYIGDVGGNQVCCSFEEVNRGVAGANYGWPMCDGPCGTPGVTNPLFSYSHGGRDASITGGFVYRGSQFPSEYWGSYFYGDYARNSIKRLTLDPSGTSVTGAFNFEPLDGSSDGPYGDIVQLKEGPDGNLYYVDISYQQATGNFGTGVIRRIRYVLANEVPVATATGTPTAGPPPLTVNFSSAGSKDPEGQPLTYLWTFGDSTSSTEPNPVHAYTSQGFYVARLSVSDGVSTSLSAPIGIAVGTPPTATILTPATGTTFRAGDTIAFSGLAADVEDGELDGRAYSWTVLFHHETHTHPFVGPLTGVTSSAFVVPATGHDFSGNTRFEIILTVTDTSGLKASRSAFIMPDKVNLSFNTVPSGLSLTVDGLPRVAPFVHDSLINFQHTIQAPNQTVGTTLFTFVSWSGGGAQTQTITTPLGPQSHTATFSVGATLDPTLTVAYGLNEGTGTIAEDLTANNKDAVLINGPAWTAGKYGIGISLDGVNDYLQTLNPALPTGNYTWEAWVNPTTFSDFSALMRAGADAEVEFALLSGGKLGVWSNNTQRTVSAGAASTGQWMHLALTRTGSTLRVYRNGVQDSVTGTDGAAYDFGGCPLLIGVDSDLGCTGLLNGYFRGSLDEIRIYSRALSQAEIQNDMATPIAPPPPDTAPPVRSNGSPTSNVPAGTTQTGIALTTNENATCRYDTISGLSYTAMTGTFSTTGGTTHTAAVTGLTDGNSYNFYVRCGDEAGNVNPDDFVIAFSVLTDTAAPLITNVNASGLTTDATITWATNEAADSQVEFGTTAALGSSTPLNPALVTSHSVVLSGLIPGTLYYYRVRSSDLSQNVATSAVAAFTTTNPDLQSPTVAITAPAAGMVVSGLIQLAANASDNVAVTRVEFYVDGGLASTDASEPYSINLDTTLFANGGHILTGKAYDAANNSASSAGVNILISNTTATPTIAPNGGTFAGSVAVTLATQTSGATIRYTTNGTIPTANSPLYSGPVTLVASATVKAIALRAGLNDSAVASAAFTITAATGLQNAFGMNEGGGTTILDSSANQNVGTLTNGPLWTPGKYGGAIQFDGVNDYVRVDSPNLPTGNFTWEAWLHPTAWSSFQAVMIARNDVGPEVDINGSGRLQVHSGTALRLTSSGALPLNAWSHVAVTRTSGTIRVYINGVQDPVTGSHSATYNFSSCPLLIGADADSGCTGLLNGYFAGRIDEVRIYNRALTATEIQSDMNTPIGP